MSGLGVSELATPLALLRGLHLAAMLSLLGTVGFIAWVLPAALHEATAVRGRLIRLWRLCGVSALLTGAAWFASQAATFASANSLAQTVAAMPVVALQTRYGRLLLLRGGLLLAATLLAPSGRAPGDMAARAPGDMAARAPSALRVRLFLALALVAVAVGLQGLIGHAGATSGGSGDVLVASEALHLLAAGLWLGALVPLWLSLGMLPARAGAAVCERFSPLGLACVLVIAGTGLAQAMQLIGGLPALVGTAYGRIALLKIALFLAALALAATNRLSLTDRLTNQGADALGRLRLSIACETLIGLAIILAAGRLASTVPGVHEPPVWPFSWRFSLTTISEDAEFWQEVIVSLVLIGLAVLLLVAACLLARFRIIALAVLAGTVAARGSSLAQLTVPAYPTSFQTSPTDFAALSISRGQILFGPNCAACHGANGEGNGPLAAGLRIKPANLTMPHLWYHSDGELFWWLTHGIGDLEGGLAMPGFVSLSDADRWALIDYVRAHNAGVAMRRDTHLEKPLAAPSLPLQCEGLNASRTADLRGKAVLVLTDDTDLEESPLPPQLGVPVVTLDLQPENAATPHPPTGGCRAATSDAWQAYAVLAGVSPDKLAGTEFLIDPTGWLRIVHPSGASGLWRTRQDLIAAVREICANPISQQSEGEHEHHH